MRHVVVNVRLFCQLPSFYKEWAMALRTCLSSPTLVLRGWRSPSWKPTGRFGVSFYGVEPIDMPLRYAGEEQVGLKLVWLGFAKDKSPVMKEYWTPILEAGNS